LAFTILSTCVPFAGEPAITRTVVLENFESYTNDQQLAKAWYRPPHGGGTRQTLEPVIKGGGRQSLSWEYSTTKDEATHYSAICRVAKWDASGCNATRFWLKPDGSGRQITIQFNIANREGKNIHDLWQVVYVPAKGDTQGRVVTVPFARLEHNVKYADSPDTSPAFKPGALIEIAFYIGGRNDEPGRGVYYIDEIEAVQVGNSSAQ
jgi:mannan endo-1,4-beta-mannosidase